MSEIDPQITIIKDNTVSIEDLATAQAAGTSVLRSAHVGNLSAYNLGLATEFLLLLVDHNQTGVDQTYQPENLVSTEGTTELTATRGTVSLRTYVDNIPNEAQDVFGSAGYLDQLHIGTLQRAIGGATITTCTDYLRANEAVAGEVVSAALQAAPEQFSRIVRPDGRVEKYDALALARSKGVLALRDDPRAPEAVAMMPNTATIATNFIVEALRSGSAMQYHLSGPDMINYATQPDFQAALSALYQRVVRTASFGRQLPRELTVRIVKATPAKFVTTSGDRQQELADIFAHLNEVGSVAAEKALFFKTDLARQADIKDAVLAVQSDRQRSMEIKVAEQLAGLPELLLDPGAKGMLTQYDVLRDGLYIPEANRTRSMSELESLAKRLATIKKRGQRP